VVMSSGGGGGGELPVRCWLRREGGRVYLVCCRDVVGYQYRDHFCNPLAPVPATGGTAADDPEPRIRMRTVSSARACSS